MKIKKILKYLLIIMALFLPLREIISYYTHSLVKFIPDLLIWGTLVIHVIKNKFKLNLKNYDVLFILFIIIGFISCIINSVSYLAFALQVRSIGTMYVLFYLLRNTEVEEKSLENTINVLVWINYFIIISSILEILSQKVLLFPIAWADKIIYPSNFVRAYSLMNNPNTFATFSLMTMLLVYFDNESKLSKKNLVFFFFCIIGIFLAASRSTLICLVFVYLVILIKAIKNKYYFNFLVMFIIALFSFGTAIAITELSNNKRIYEFVSEIINNDKDDIPILQSPSTQNQEPGQSSVPEQEEKPNSGNNLNSNEEKVESTEKEENNTSNLVLMDRFEEMSSGKTKNDSKVNGRIFVIKKGFDIYKDHPIIGTGFATYGSAGSRMVTPEIYKTYNLYTGFYSDNEYIKIIVETGTIGIIIFGMFCLILLIKCIKERNFEQFTIYIVFLFIGMFYNIFEMQVLCFVFYFSYYYFGIKRKIKEINQNKVAILALHLGTGGVEQVVVNTANMLCNKYDVEIISLYKNNKPIPFVLNDKVKVTYLMNTISNREEIKNAIKSKNIFSIIKEAVKAAHILVNKNRLMIKAISSSDASVIISTRYSFSKLLNDFGNIKQHKIHQEHTYSVSNEYIKKLNMLKLIDCIMPASQTIYEKYKTKVRAKLVYIPFVLNYYPKESEISKLNTKNLIAIGRLEKEKGFNDLLNIIAKLNDSEIFLNLFGDGSLKAQLEKQAKELGIEKQVKFWGFKNQEFIKKYMLNSSLYIMTSHEESFGLVLIEAMSYGVPCIAYDSAEGAKYTINKENGYFIKNRNEKEMIKTIQNYLNLSEKEKKTIGNAAKKTIDTYNYDKIKKQWLYYLEEILEAKR